MSKIFFEKYQGTGNDFIMIDNREGQFKDYHLSQIGNFCDRNFGIGSDGLILIEDHPEYDFEMQYFNPDGTQSLCGNGSRCAVMYCHNLKIISNKTTFFTIEGKLDAEIIDQIVSIKMPAVSGYTHFKEDLFIHTGSPHLVRFVTDIEEIDVLNEGKKIRYNKKFNPEGTNVNFVQKMREDRIFVRTYERGVENETLSCGTGVTASAIALGLKNNQKHIYITTKGGDLEVKFEPDGSGGFTNIYLIGTAVKVYAGWIDIK